MRCYRVDNENDLTMLGSWLQTLRLWRWKRMTLALIERGENSLELKEIVDDTFDRVAKRRYF
jgi:hypothetical protein